MEYSVYQGLLAPIGQANIFVPATASLKRRAVDDGLGDVDAILRGSGTLVVNGIAISIILAKVMLKSEFQQEEFQSCEHRTASFRPSGMPLMYFTTQTDRHLVIVQAPDCFAKSEGTFVINEFLLIGWLKGVAAVGLGSS
jgi:hypothetical protein